LRCCRLISAAAQTSLYSAQQILVSVRLARLTNLVGLYQALGGGSIERSGDAPRPAEEVALREPSRRAVLADGLRPEPLFPDDAPLAERLQRHSALPWKIENVKRHQSACHSRHE
jgi:hypothetical protein